MPGLWILGLGSQYPDHLLASEELEAFAERFHDTKTEGLQKLFAINKRTGIETRAAVIDLKKGLVAKPEPPTIVELDEHFRIFGVDLAVQACNKALVEAEISHRDITHTVAVTCTNQGNPGYDLLVNKKLGLRSNVDHTLLHGVGCAGGLSIMRAAVQVALAATARRKPARVLAYACELCTPNIRAELAVAEKTQAGEVGLAAALFSDGAAAFVLSNDFGRGKGRARFRLLAFDNAVLPGTMDCMSYLVDPYGARTTLTRAIPGFTVAAVRHMFDNLVREYSTYFGRSFLKPLDFDWALHPGGASIIAGVEETMGLVESDRLRASREVYRSRGNCSSPTVLMVLDLLRTMGDGKEHVVAASFGPGLSVEMAMLQRCQITE